MKALCFLPDLDGGGAERTMVNLVNHLGGFGFAPSLAVARGDGPAGAWLSPHVPLLDLGCRRTLTALPKLWSTILRQHPRVLFSTMIDANVVSAVALALSRRAVPHVVRETNSQRARGDLSLLQRMGIRFAYGRAARVVALSEGVRRELIEDLALDPAKVVTIHNPVDVAGLKARADAARAQPAPWGRHDGRMVVAIGRLTRQKGFDVLLRAFAGLADQSIHLTILGSGGERDALTALAAELGVAERLSMPGFVADPVPWLAHADLFVLSSRWEGFGHVIAEAMACGTAVVATNCPHGPADIVSDGVDGRLVVPEDDDALSRVMAETLADDAGRRRMADAALASVERFALPAIAGRYAQVLAEVME